MAIDAVDVPPSIRLVRDFVNTVEWQEDAETWNVPADLAAWFEANAGQSQRLDAGDLTLAKRIREGLRSVLLLNAGHAPLATSIDDINDALSRVPLAMSFGATGDAAIFSPSHPFASIVQAIEEARRDGTWSRLKACSRDSCRWAYWDSSRNGSGRWCSMTGCGNYLKMRRRNRPGESESEVIPEVGRRPTLVDVAGRAGVSIKTVSNVVTGAYAVSASTRTRVQAAIDELGYVPNLEARALVARKQASPAD